LITLYNQNATATAEEYAARFPNRRRPNPHVILRFISRATHTGFLNLILKGVAGAPRTARVHAMEEAVLEAVEQDPRSMVIKSKKFQQQFFYTNFVFSFCSFSRERVK
jgi:hypothetical protein